jgi:hypothetical protein
MPLWPSKNEKIHHRGHRVHREIQKVGIKKEKQLWTSHRCFPGCVLEVVCLFRRWKNDLVAQIRKILGKIDFSISSESRVNPVAIQTSVK